VELQENPAGTFHCKNRNPQEFPQDIVWFQNGTSVSAARGQKSVRFNLPSDPQKVGCLWISAKQGLLTGAAAESVLMPKAPEFVNLPTALVVMKNQETRFTFEVDNSLGAVSLRCTAQNARGQTLSFCKEEPSSQKGFQRFLFSDRAQALAAQPFDNPHIKIAIKTEHGTFLRSIPFEILHNTVKPRVLGVWAHKGQSGEGHCLFLAHDPNNHHFTARVVWQDDPGRIQDFSTFLRNETTTLIPADVFFRDASLKQKHLFVGEAILSPIAGRPSCKVIASNGILFAAQKSKSKASAHEAKDALFAAANQASVQQVTPKRESRFSSLQTSAQPSTSQMMQLFAFRAGENWETAVPATRIASCTGHDDFCKSVALKGRKLSAQSTTVFAPGRAFLALKKASGDHLFAFVEIQNPAFSGHRREADRVTDRVTDRVAAAPQSCSTLIEKLIAGDIAPGTFVTLTNSQNQKVPLASFTSFSPTDRAAARCSLESPARR
jgi:hypothetical protein